MLCSKRPSRSTKFNIVLESIEEGTGCYALEIFSEIYKYSTAIHKGGYGGVIFKGVSNRSFETVGGILYE